MAKEIIARIELVYGQTYYADSISNTVLNKLHPYRDIAFDTNTSGLRDGLRSRIIRLVWGTLENGTSRPDPINPDNNTSSGLSAYEIAVKNGFNGSEADWLESLRGPKGDTGQDGAKGEKGDSGERGEKGDMGPSAYAIAHENGFKGTVDEWLEYLKGDNGASAYDIAVRNGFTGSEKDWLESLQGKSTFTEHLAMLAEDDYEDKFSVLEGEVRTQFVLTHKPIGKIRLFISGMRYFNNADIKYFDYDSDTNTVTWLNTDESQGGFKISGMDVVFEYDYDKNTETIRI